MFKALAKLLIKWGKHSNSKRDTYSPQYRGKWTNKGTDYSEDWQWVEKVKARPLEVSVFNLEDDYIITVSAKARPNSIEVIPCKDDREVEIAIDLLKAYYSTLGNVIISTEAG